MADHLTRRQHGRQSLRPPGPHDALQLIERLSENLVVKKKQARESLVLCGGGHVFPNSSMREELIDLSLTHLLRMPLPMKQDIPLRPMHVRLFRAQCQMPQSRRIANPIE